MSTDRIWGILLLAVALTGVVVLLRHRSGAANDRARPVLSRRKRLLYAIATLLVFSVVAYAGSVVYRSAKLYDRAKHGPSWRGHVFTQDDELGFRHVPGVNGAETRDIGPDVP